MEHAGNGRIEVLTAECHSIPKVPKTFRGQMTSLGIDP